MILETNRLKIVPLTKEQFQLLLVGTDKMEQALGLTPSYERMDEETQMAMKYNYVEALRYPDHYLWYANWQIILKSENKAIGSACFKHKPDKYGQVEIGYGTNSDYRNQGYMTEAVKALSEWALRQTNVNSVIAETYKDNPASMRVLEKCRMVKYKVTDTSLWWKLNNIPDYKIRQETEKDYPEIYNLIKIAFETAKVKDGNEQDFANGLRNSENYIPELALVAETEDMLIGHIMFTKTYVIQPDNSKFEGLLIAPLSILLEYRNMGIGSILIKEGFRLAKKSGYKAVFLCGDPAYYNRFGFRSTASFGIKYAHDVPEKYIMAYELEKGALDRIIGTIDCQ